jgi:hypothetical protein
MNLRGGYQPRSNLVKDENGDLIADSHNILHRWMNYSQSMNIHRVSEVKQIEIHIAEPLVPDHSRFEAEIATAKFKRYKSPCSDQILAEQIQARGETLQSKIRKLINSIWNKGELPDQWTAVIIMGYHCYQLHTKFYPISFSQG